MFRHGFIDDKKIVWQSIKFGLIHSLIMGLPLSIGIAFIITGLYFGFKYRKKYYEVYNPPGPMPKIKAEDEALLTSSAYHLVYNSIIFSILTLCVVVLICLI